MRVPFEAGDRDLPGRHRLRAKDGEGVVAGRIALLQHLREVRELTVLAAQDSGVGREGFGR
jgi:hypothetical protein